MTDAMLSSHGYVPELDEEAAPVSTPTTSAEKATQTEPPRTRSPTIQAKRRARSIEGKDRRCCWLDCQPACGLMLDLVEWLGGTIKAFGELAFSSPAAAF